MNKLLFSIVALTLCGCSNCLNEVNSKREISLNAYVDSIYKSPQNRFTPTIRIYDTILRRTFEMDGYYFPDLRLNSAIGDRVLKDANSLLFKLIKKDSTIIEFYPVCDGEKIK